MIFLMIKENRNFNLCVSIEYWWRSFFVICASLKAPSWLYLVIFDQSYYGKRNLTLKEKLRGHEVIFALVSNKKQGLQEPVGKRLRSYVNLISEEDKIKKNKVRTSHSVLTDEFENFRHITYFWSLQTNRYCSLLEVNNRLTVVLDKH